jgi:hypothetical protein
MNLDTVLGIVISTIVLIFLRWSASRWPTASERRLQQRADRIAELEDRLAIKKLEDELGEGMIDDNEKE